MLDAALPRGAVLEHSCCTGRCGNCKARVTHGMCEVAHGQAPALAQVIYSCMAHNHVEAHQKHAEPWKVTLVERSDESMTGDPRVADYARDEEGFCFSYGDCVSDIDLYEESLRRNA